MSFSIRRNSLFELDHDLVRGDAVARADIDRLHDAGRLRTDDVLHLHRLDDADRLTLFHSLAYFHVNRDDQSRHWRNDQLGRIRLRLFRQARMQAGRQRRADQRPHRNAAMAEDIAFSPVGEFDGKWLAIKVPFKEMRAGPPVGDERMVGAINRYCRFAVAKLKLDILMLVAKNNDPVAALLARLGHAAGNLGSASGNPSPERLQSRPETRP